MNQPQKTIPTATLGNTGVSVTQLGFGAATLGNLYRPLETSTAQAAIDTAWDAGIRYFDTAPSYGFGLSERRLGDGLREHIKDYVISTKVGILNNPCAAASDKLSFCSPMPFEPIYDYSYDGIMRSFEHSVQRLGLSRIDILYMHDIGTLIHGDANKALFSTAMNSGYKAMHRLREQGLVKAIGLGVNEYEVCEDAMAHGDFDCFLLAGRYTLLEQSALETFLPRCAEKNISVIIGGPYNSGILAKGSRPQGEAPFYNYASAPAHAISRVQLLEATCEDFNIPLAAAALQFPLAHPAVASVIPGLRSPERVESSKTLYSISIPAEFWHELKTRGLMRADAPTP